MSGQIAALLTQLAKEALSLIPDLIRAIRDGDHEQAARLAERAAKASAAKAAIRVKRP